MTESHSRPQLRIAVFSSYTPAVGGGEIQTALQLRELAKRGHNVTVVDLRPRESGPNEENVDGVRVLRVRVPSSRLLATPTFHLGLFLHAIRLAQSIDVVQFNHIGIGLLGPALVFEALGIPRVLVIWGSSAPGIGPFGHGFRKRLARFVARRQNWIVSLASPPIANLTRRGFDPARIRFIPNGVETDRFYPPDPGTPHSRPLGLPTRSPTVITVGRLVPAKALDVLLDAWPVVVAHTPAAKLVIAGDGPLRPKLCEQIAHSGIANSVVFLGARRDVPELLRSADVYVSASRTEGMSNALLEALSSGLPLVATAVGGAIDTVKDGVNGTIISPGDRDALAGALVALLRDPGLRRRYGRASRTRALSEFSIGAVVDRYLDLYESTVGLRRSRGQPRLCSSGSTHRPD